MTEHRYASLSQWIPRRSVRPKAQLVCIDRSLRANANNHRPNCSKETFFSVISRIFYCILLFLGSVHEKTHLVIAFHERRREINYFIDLNHPSLQNIRNGEHLVDFMIPNKFDMVVTRVQMFRSVTSMTAFRLSNTVPFLYWWKFAWISNILARLSHRQLLDRAVVTNCS